MSGGIVYDGVGTSSGGTLFQGTKFWISLRCPMRNSFIDKVQSNGGEIVKLEKLADILIADHVRKDSPPGSYSYKYLEECIKQGTQVDKEPYLIASRTGPSRPVGSSVPGKGTRTPFTVRDDEILVEWVMPHFRRGETTAGNEIYKFLELQYPHHTYQSWRDRWVKKLRHIHETSSNAGTAPPPHPPQVNAVESAPRRLPAKDQTQRAAPTSARVPFSDEDDRLLIDYVEGRVSGGQRPSGNKIYQEFAEEHAHYSWHAWRDRYLRHLRPQMDEEVEEEQAPRQQNKPATDAKQVISAPQATATPKRSAPDRGAITPNSRTRHSAARAPAQVNDAGVDSAAVSTNIDNENERQDRTGGGQDQDETRLQNFSPRHANNTEQLPEKPRSNRQQFFDDLKDFMEANESFVPLWPQVNSRAVDLFDLYQEATGNNADPEERDWEQIAENLGYDWIQDPSVTTKLQECFQINLADFELALRDFDEMSDEDDEGQNREAGEDGEDEEGVNQPGANDMRSSPPVVIGLKRSLEMAMMSDATYPSGSMNKRPRLRPTDEVPSTPDDKIGVTKRTNTDALFSSPSKRQNMMASPELDSTRDSSQQLPPHSRTLPTAHREPVAQDVQDDVFFDGEQLDVTPSQQLRSEYHLVSPKAFRLGKEVIPATATSRTPPTNGLSEKAMGKRPMRSSEPLTRSHDRVLNHQNPLAMIRTAKRRTLPATFGLPKATPPPSAQSRTIAPRARSEINDEDSMFVFDDPPPAPQIGPRAAPRAAPTAPHSLPSVRATSLPQSQRQRTLSPPQPAVDSRTGGDQDHLAATIDHYVALGYPEHVVIDALKAATMNLGLAGTVMEDLMAGKGVPSHHEGVWTRRDDEALAMIDSVDPDNPRIPKAAAEKQVRRAQKEWRKLEYKHGVERIEERRRFLSMMDV